MERLQQVLQMEVGKSWFKIVGKIVGKLWLFHPWECPNPGWDGGRCPCPWEWMGFKVPKHSGILYSASSQPLCSEIWKEQIFKVQSGSPWSCQDPRQPLHTRGFVLVSVSHPEHLWQNPVQRSPVPSLCYSPGKFLSLLSVVLGMKWFLRHFCASEAPASAPGAEIWMEKVDFVSQLPRGRWCKVQKSLLSDEI